MNNSISRHCRLMFFKEWLERTTQENILKKETHIVLTREWNDRRLNRVRKRQNLKWFGWYGWALWDKVEEQDFWSGNCRTKTKSTIKGAGTLNHRPSINAYFSRSRENLRGNKTTYLVCKRRRKLYSNGRLQCPRWIKAKKINGKYNMSVLIVIR